jgi:hypothetical protein
MQVRWTLKSHVVSSDRLSFETRLIRLASGYERWNLKYIWSIMSSYPVPCSISHALLLVTSLRFCSPSKESINLSSKFGSLCFEPRTLYKLARLSVFIGFAERISGIKKEFIKIFIRILMLKQVKKKKKIMVQESGHNWRWPKEVPSCVRSPCHKTCCLVKKLEQMMSALEKKKKTNSICSWAIWL